MPIKFKRYKPSLKFGQSTGYYKSNREHLKIYEIYLEIKNTITETKT